MVDSVAGRSGSRGAFFRLVFGPHRGIVALWFRSNDSTGRHFHRYFDYPQQLPELLATIEKYYQQNDVYYCPQFLKAPELNAKNVVSCPVVWADLDTCEPEKLLVQPTALIETSPGRYHAVWRFESPLDPQDGQRLSKRIAYFHADDGCDRSGWDLSQLLRVPVTFNFKYSPQPEVSVIDSTKGVYRVEDFEEYPDVTVSMHEQIPFPETLPEESGQELVEAYRKRFQGPVWELYTQRPEGPSWSEPLWKLMRLCFEAGMSREQVFKVADTAACNKFARKGLGSDALWKDVCRAWAEQEKNDNPIVQPSQLDDLLSPEEFSSVANAETFVERYIEWASSLGDAAVQYHQAGAFIILSALLAGRVRLPTSFGTIIPNLWFMLLADTTLTRKTTAMDVAMDLLAEVEDQAIMATDGSLEGVMQALSMRPGVPSIFLRDEFSGLLEMIAKKDYYAGMAEMLTKLYDGKLQKRLLRKETIEIRDPILITFAGGIRDRVQQLLSLDHVSSGFVPRFLFITALSDTSKVQPLGPPTIQDLEGRSGLLEELSAIRNFYSQQIEFVPPNGKSVLIPKKWDARLTEQAWQRYNRFERQMLDAGLKSDRPDLMTPVYSRMAVSTLKATLLLAACRQRNNEEVVITLDDVLLAIKYCTEWRNYAIEVINGVGKGAVESRLERVHENIKRNPGVSRSTLMQNYHLTAREADAIFTTLEQRGVVTAARAGRGVAYYAVR